MKIIVSTLQLILAFFVCIAYIVPYFLLLVITFAHHIITGGDLLHTKFVKKFQQPLYWVEKNWIEKKKDEQQEI